MSDVIERVRAVAAHRCFDWDCAECNLHEALAVNCLPALLDVLHYVTSEGACLECVRCDGKHEANCLAGYALAALEKELPK